MDELSWLAAIDPRPMLDHLQGRIGPRKLGLFAVACCRRLWPLLDDSLRRTVDRAERHADETGSEREGLLLRGASQAISPPNRLPSWQVVTSQEAILQAVNALRPESSLPGVGAAMFAAESALNAATRGAVKMARTGEEAVAAAVDTWTTELRVQADLLRDVVGNPFQAEKVNAAWLQFGGGTVAKMTQVFCQERRFGDLPILADALEDAGCDSEAILTHCRGPGPHTYGCWVLDLLRYVE